MGGAAPTDSQGRPLPEGWKRFVSSLIDGGLVFIVSYIIQIIFFAGTTAVTVDPDTGLVTDSGGFLAGTFGVVIVIWVLEFLYFTILNGMEKGQTVGKMIMKIQLRDEATGGPVGMGKAALRTLIMILLSIPCGIPMLVSALFPLWDPKRQTLHDKATNTICVETQ
jgi:uncharacterized RDD family membrane protein YckC